MAVAFSWLILLVCGVLCVAGGVRAIIADRRMRGPVDAVIVGVQRHFTGKSNANFPVVRFYAEHGEEVKALVPQGKVFSSPKIGKRVPIIYDPANSEFVRIRSIGWRIRGLIFIFGGAVFLFLAAGMLLLILAFHGT